MMRSFLNIACVSFILTSSVRSHGNKAQDVSIADFKAGFVSSGIVPEITAKFDPSVAFFAGFTASDGSAALLEPGTTLTISEAKAPFELSVANIKNATNVTSSTRFLVYMIGPDVPSRSNPTSRNVRHFLAGNLTLSSKNSTLLPSATVLQNSSAATDEYAAPAPSPNTGSHRYVYLFYVQPPALNTRSFASFGFNASARTGFNLTKFRSQFGLASSIGGTFFTIDTDNNNSSTTNTTTSTSTNSISTSSSGSTSTSTSSAGTANSSTAISITSVAASGFIPGSWFANVGAVAVLMGALFVALL